MTEREKEQKREFLCWQAVKDRKDVKSWVALKWQTWVLENACEEIGVGRY